MVRRLGVGAFLRGLDMGIRCLLDMSESTCTIDWTTYRPIAFRKTFIIGVRLSVLVQRVDGRRRPFLIRWIPHIIPPDSEQIKTEVLDGRQELETAHQHA